jgi:heme-degrading monooxygenase HmoA
MVVVLFRSRIRPENADEYYSTAARMTEIAESMPGFISFKTYESEDGERISVHEWESEEHLRAWREHPQHREVQQRGRDLLYQEYTLYVLDSPRESRFTMNEKREI